MAPGSRVQDTKQAQHYNNSPKRRTENRTNAVPTPTKPKMEADKRGRE
jgi:hypothetical protein